MAVKPGDSGRWGILLAVSAAALVAVVLIDALVVSDIRLRLALLVLSVGIIAERSADARTALGAAGMAWPMGNGFLENRTGILSWHPDLDFPFALGLLCAVAVGMCVALGRALRKHQDSASGRPAALASARDIRPSPARPAVTTIGRPVGAIGRRTHGHVPLHPVSR